MRKAVNVYRSQEALVVESTSMLSGGGRVAAGWIQVLPVADLTPEALGAAVVAGLEQSGSITAEQLPPLGGTGATPGSRALGFETENVMLAAGVASAGVGLKDTRWKVTPMRSEGPGRGFGGHPDAPPVTHEGEWPPAELGSAVLSALDASV